eukprot:TRINITY_DN19264_c0_g1::TRINITY_DN19264_c0_g1_i1::g.15833::m.15833 TRINITY_DN19264_c0_g1::TRINITY_DN19264_c0_g1_i1::g.15833  ORF type:complete len:193 (-),score=2.90,MDMPI_C/PF07398.6/2.1,MDMPI_C/PF07398.6/1.3e+03 TRINITY_DN19264_c0_g1_i1:605-1183(-)
MERICCSRTTRPSSTLHEELWECMARLTASRVLQTSLNVVRRVGSDEEREGVAVGIGVGVSGSGSAVAVIACGRGMGTVSAAATGVNTLSSRAVAFADSSSPDGSTLDALVGVVGRSDLTTLSTERVTGSLSTTPLTLTDSQTVSMAMSSEATGSWLCRVAGASCGTDAADNFAQSTWAMSTIEVDMLSTLI